MFSTLDEEIKKTSGRALTPLRRAMEYAGVAAATALVFGALYATIVFFE